MAVKLDNATDEYVPKAMDSKKQEYVMVLKHSDSSHYYVSRRQLYGLKSFLRVKQAQGYTEITRSADPNSVNMYNRFKETKDPRFVIKTNKIFLQNGT